MNKQIVIEAFMRYYDLLSFSEQICVEKKSQRKTKRTITAAKQKLIFYLSYLKSPNRVDGGDYWQPGSLGVPGFVDLFANDRMYQKISQTKKD